MKRTRYKVIKGGVAAPRGFRAAGWACGIKKRGAEDLALIYSEEVASAAGAFTANRLSAAPVRLSRKQLQAGRGRAVIANSGAANACTGRGGEEDARKMVRETASALGIDFDLVCVCSTGRIGKKLPLRKITAGIKELAGIIAAGGNNSAARAIMTTDTRPKELAIEFPIGNKTVRIGGMAKGAGMIYPHLEVSHPLHATMLAFITTDAAVSPARLREMLSRSVRQSFNRVTVDGDTSTNDSVILLANGRSSVRIGRAGLGGFQEALDYVTRSLARMIAADGEGASKFIELEVRGARSHREADRAAAAVANSVLFKTALYGRTPNWGRILAALGYSGAEVREDKINIYLEQAQIIKKGLPTAGSVQSLLRKKELKFTIDLGIGQGRSIYYTCDLTPEYVEINKK